MCGCALISRPANELLEVADRHWRAALADEQERRSALGLAVQATQRPQLAPGQRMRRRGAVLRSGDRQRRSFKVHLRPLQVTQLGRSQAMPEGDQDHGLIPLRPAIAAAAGDQPLDLAFAEVFAGSDIGVLGPARLDFPYYSGWRDDFQGWFWH